MKLILICCFPDFSWVFLTLDMTHTYTLHTPKKAAFGRPWNNARERAIWIGAQLKLRGISFSELARQNGYSPSSFTNTAAGKANANIEPILAAAVEQPASWLFHEHYNQAGERIAAVRGSNRTATRDSRKVQKSAAA